jgi:hypothetical protein
MPGYKAQVCIPRGVIRAAAIDLCLAPPTADLTAEQSFLRAVERGFKRGILRQLK